jgi:hypothetical protein
MKTFLKSLFTCSSGQYSCRLIFGSIGWCACIACMFCGCDNGNLSLMASLSAALMGLSAVEGVARITKHGDAGNVRDMGGGGIDVGNDGTTIKKMGF